MPGGKGKIDEYNKSLTAEQRKESAKKAAKAPRKAKTIKQIAKMINDMPAPEAAKSSLKEFGIEGEDMTNAAMIALAVLRAAFEGDLRAVEKWERYVDQYDSKRREKAELAVLEAKAKAISIDGNSAEPIQIIITPPDNSNDN